MLWARCQSGEDVWAEYQEIDRDLIAIDAMTVEHLSNNDKLIDQAWQRSAAALAPG